MAALIPAFVSALLIARDKTQSNNVAEENLQKLYHKTGLSNVLIDLISCIEKCQANDLFKDINTKKRYEDAVARYSNKAPRNNSYKTKSMASAHKREYNRKRTDQLLRSRNQYIGCILACIEKFTQEGGSLIDIQHGMSNELINYYCPDFTELINIYMSDEETKNFYLNHYKTMGLIGGRRKTRQKKRRKRKKTRKKRTKRRKNKH